MSYGPGLLIEFVPYTRFVAIEKKTHFILPKFSNDWYKIPPYMLCYIPILPH